ncbi:CBS domain-containing protein [Candidatus Latescibacterota bacterium]
MTQDIVIVHPKDRIGKLREILRVNRISGTPIVENNKLVGIISIEDFIKCLAE